MWPERSVVLLCWYPSWHLNTQLSMAILPSFAFSLFFFFLNFCSEFCVSPGINGLSSCYLLSKAPDCHHRVLWVLWAELCFLGSDLMQSPDGPYPDFASCPNTLTPVGGQWFCAPGSSARTQVTFGSHDSSSLNLSGSLGFLCYRVILMSWRGQDCLHCWASQVSLLSQKLESSWEFGRECNRSDDIFFISLVAPQTPFHLPGDTHVDWVDGLPGFFTFKL